MAPAASRKTIREWNALTPAYRKRLVAAAASGRLTGNKITGTDKQIATAARDYWRSGGSLKTARGNHPVTPPKRVRPPEAATKAAQRGEATSAQLRELRTWQRNRAPQWIKNARGLSEDTAAILANVNLQPKNWASVDVYRQPNGSIVVYIKSKKGGPDRRLVLPDETALAEMLGLLTPEGGVMTGEVASTFVRQYGYARSDRTNTTPEIPTRRQGTALPRTRSKK
jgi:hypothetical protein